MSREISTGWWNDVARAIFGFQEQKPVELEDAIRVCAVLELERPEWGFLKREKRFASADTGVAAVAAEFGFVGVHNPADSGVLTIVEGFDNTSVGQEMQERSGLFEATFSPAIDSSIPFTGARDTRDYSLSPAGLNVPPNSGSRFIVGTASGVQLANMPPFGTFHAENVVQGQQALLFANLQRWRHVVAPGGIWIAVSTVVLSAISGIVAIRERPLHKGVRA